MSFELDHVFIATTRAGEIETALREIGLVFSRRTRHPGQGTANSCALFDNAFFEILWPDNEEEIRSDLVAPLGLWHRSHSSETGACPFGIAFRPTANSDSSDVPGIWSYNAAYRPGAGIPIVTPRDMFAEPLLFISPGGRRPVEYPDVPPGDLRQWGSNRTLTAVRVFRPGEGGQLPAGLQWFCDRNLLALEDGPEFLMELEWNHGIEGQSREFRSPAALRFRW